MTNNTHTNDKQHTHKRQTRRMGPKKKTKPKRKIKIGLRLSFLSFGLVAVKIFATFAAKLTANHSVSHNLHYG